MPRYWLPFHLRVHAVSPGRDRQPTLYSHDETDRPRESQNLSIGSVS
jgi:hypothetical protein